jgi:hypothetical protein
VSASDRYAIANRLEEQARVQTSAPLTTIDLLTSLQAALAPDAARLVETAPALARDA